MELSLSLDPPPSMSASLTCLYDNGGEAACGLRPREVGRGVGWSEAESVLSLEFIPRL